MFSTIRRLVVLGSFAVLAMLAVSCSPRGKGPTTVKPLAVEDADDIAQQFGMLIATDRGGFLVDVLTTIEGVPLYGPPVGPSLAARMVS